MTSDEQRALIIAAAVGMPLMLAGFYAIKRWQPSMTTRLGLGVGMFVAGAALIYPFIFGPGDLIESPVRFGFCVPLIGLGINQMAAPFRVAAGNAA